MALALFSAVRADSEAIRIPDTHLERVVRQTLGIPFRPIQPTDMDRLVELDASERDIANLFGLERAHNLRRLFLSHNDLDSLDPISMLDELEIIVADHNRLSLLPAGAEWTNLIALNVSFNVLRACHEITIAILFSGDE